MLSCTLAAAACSSSGTVRERAQRTRPNAITQEEIARVTASTALDLIQKLRPQYLRRIPISLEGRPYATAAVFVDNVQFGQLDALRLVPAATVREVQYIDAGDATIRYGTGYPAGAILILTKQ
ncbi:MAG: hypothetical protein ACT4R6_00025 [Gemmatimonadaceae bacterium]